MGGGFIEKVTPDEGLMMDPWILGRRVSGRKSTRQGPGVRGSLMCLRNGRRLTPSNPTEHKGNEPRKVTFLETV